MVKNVSDEQFHYQPLSDEDFQKLWQKHKKVIETFIEGNEYSSEGIYINEKAVMAIIAKVDQRRKYFKYFHGLDMSEYKEAALICFWYIKLHPICSYSNESNHEMNEFDAINEKLAVYYLLVTIKGLLKLQGMDSQKVDSLPEEYIKELIYSFTYRDLSKEALILLLESISMFLGLNPYNVVKDQTILNNQPEYKDSNL